MKKKIFVFATILMNLVIQAQDGSELPFQKWALTPPMGWNSWDCFGPSVVESEVKANADYMAANLKDHGWEYVVVDIRWYVDNQTTGHYNAFNDSNFVYDEYGRYIPSPTRFPSSINGAGFKPLGDYIHGLGLKFGIHIMRGIPKKAVTEKLPIKGTSYTADQIYSTAYECTWLQDNWTIDDNKEGAQEYYNSILDLYASWGVDYIKVDDLSRPYHDKEIEFLRNAIDQTGRPMLLSMSPGATPLDQHEHAKNHANLWRTIDDFWDNWSQLNYSFDVCADWAPYISPGAYPDADMLPLGHLSIRGERGADRMTSFTEDEQYTLMSLWSIFKSPLMFGGHLPDNDAFTDELITNDEVLFMHKTSVNNQEWFNGENGIGWFADDPSNGDKYVALFNDGGNEFVDTKNLLYRSGTVSTLTDGYAVDIDLNIGTGNNSLFLIVDGTSDGFNYDHADWINPTIYLDDNTTINLTDLDWEYATAGWGSVTKNKSISGGDLNIKGTTYTNGIGTHSNSIIRYQIPENTVRFTAYAGLDIGGTNQSSTPTIEFMISTLDPTPRDVDVSKAIANTGRISRSAQREGENISVDITGASKLYLVVTDAGDNFNYDHADWINPTISKPNGESLALSTLDWVSATSGWDTVKKNASVDGNALTVNGVTYANGFGVNAYSIIEFDLPEGYTLFESFCGFDDEVLNASDGVTIEFMVFTQDPANNSTMTIPVDLNALGFSGDCTVRNLWSKTDLGTYSASNFAPVINEHGSGLYRISALNRLNTAEITLSGPTQVSVDDNVTLNINVVTGTNTPSGWVMLYQDDNHVGTIELDASGNAQYNTSFSGSGTSNFIAKYSGNANFAPKDSSEIQVNIESLSIKKKNKLKIEILRTDKKSFLKGITPGDHVKIFNIYGQKIVDIIATSSTMPINYFEGLAIIKIKTGNDLMTLKAVL